MHSVSCGAFGTECRLGGVRGRFEGRNSGRTDYDRLAPATSPDETAGPQPPGPPTPRRPTAPPPELPRGAVASEPQHQDGFERAGGPGHLRPRWGLLGGGGRRGVAPGEVPSTVVGRPPIPNRGQRAHAGR